MFHDSDHVETFVYSAEYEDGGPLARRIARARADELTAIGRPVVWSPNPLSPFTRRALAAQLPPKEYGR